MAKTQLKFEREREREEPLVGMPPDPELWERDREPEPPEARLPRRFYASVEVDPDRLGRDAGRIAEEVVQHLTTLPGNSVRVTLEIEVEAPEGVPEDTQRVVTESCQTLSFKDHGFENR